MLKFSRLFPLVLLSATALPSAPAFAGRAAACKAPPFSVPSETQRAVDAAIDARIASAGSGKVGTSVDSRTEYETTTLTQDAIARAWVEYTLCLKLAKRLIGQDLHDELLRGLLTPRAESEPFVASETAAGATPPIPAPLPAQSLQPSDLLGTWQVISRYTHGSCPRSGELAVVAYTWVVSANDQGGLVVSAQGQTSYPLLEGRIEDGVLRVGGPAMRDGVEQASSLMQAADGRMLAILPRADFELRSVGDALEGTRQLAFWSSRLSDDMRTWVIEPCTSTYAVRVTR